MEEREERTGWIEGREREERESRDERGVRYERRREERVIEERLERGDMEGREMLEMRVREGERKRGVR